RRIFLSQAQPFEHEAVHLLLRRKPLEESLQTFVQLFPFLKRRHLVRHFIEFNLSLRVLLEHRHERHEPTCHLTRHVPPARHVLRVRTVGSLCQVDLAFDSKSLHGHNVFQLQWGARWNAVSSCSLHECPGSGFAGQSFALQYITASADSKLLPWHSSWLPVIARGRWFCAAASRGSGSAQSCAGHCTAPFQSL